MKNIPGLVIALSMAVQVLAVPSDTCNQNTWFTNGTVNAIVPAGGKVFIGGYFTQVGPYTGGGVPVNSSTGLAVHAFPKINGTVNTVCADSNGGWFVGGQFTFVGGVARNNVAHILLTGEVDLAWNPNANYPVLSLVKSGTTVYVGGYFTVIGGVLRNYIAALDASTGDVLAWYPNADYDVYSLVVSGTTVFAGGKFTHIGGQSRYNIAALNATTGDVLAWSPNASGPVYSLALSGTTVYAGGYFGTIGGQSRSCIAALDVTTGNATSWNADADSSVFSLAVTGTTVYVGGKFASIGGKSHNGIAAVDATSGIVSAWNPNALYSSDPFANYGVLSLAVSGTTVYAGGTFTNIGGQIRNGIAALDATTGNALAWNPNANMSFYSSLDKGVFTLAVSGTMVYVGGSFTSIGGQSRNNIAALDATTGQPTGWNPNANNGVNVLVMSGSTLFAGGGFDSIGGQSRHCIAALDATTGNVLAWNPNASEQVFALAVSGTKVYAGGWFKSIGGQSRNCIAALDATTGNVLAWNPRANSYLSSLAVSGSMVYAGGSFDTIGGQRRSGIAALDATTGNALAWNPNARYHDPYSYMGRNWPAEVYSIAVNGTTVYAGGIFDSIGGQSRNCIAALDATTGNALAWNPNAIILSNSNVKGLVYSLAVSGTTVYAGGDFDYIGEQNRNHIAALDATTGNALAWDPNANSTVSTLAVSGATVYAGGGFTSIGQGMSHPFFAQFDTLPGFSPVARPIIARSSLNNTGLQIIGSTLRSGACVKFTYALPAVENVSLRLYSLNGQLQSELVNKHQSGGNYSLTMQRGNLAAGAYLVVFKADDVYQEKMISLMK